MSQQDNPGPPIKKTIERPKTLLTDEEMSAGNKAFVALVKERDGMIAKAKRAKRIFNADS